MTSTVMRQGALAAVAATLALLAGGTASAMAAAGDPYLTSCLTSASGIAGCTNGTADLTGARAVALSPDGKQLYAVGLTRVAVYDRDPSSGALTKASTIAAPLTLSNPQDVLVSPDGKSVYVSDAATSSITEFARAAGGSLSVPAQPCVTGAGLGTVVNGCREVTGMGIAHGLAMDAQGNNLYVSTDLGEGHGGSILVLNRAADGSLTQKTGSDPADTTPGCFTDVATAGCSTARGISHRSWQLALTPDGKNLYATGYEPSYPLYTCINFGSGCNYFPTGAVSAPSGGVAIFDRDTATGKLSQPAGTAACITDNGQDGGNATFPSLAPGPVRCAAGSAALDQAHSVVTSPDGKFVYVGSDRGIVVYERDPSTGALADKGCYQQPRSGAGCADSGAPAEGTNGLGQVYRMAITPDGSTLVAESKNNGGFAILQRDAATGALSPQPGKKGCITPLGNAVGNTAVGVCEAQPGFAGGDGSVAVSADSMFMYLTSQPSGTLATYDRDFAPRCQDETVSVPYQTSVVVPITCTDVNGDALTLAITRQPTNGTLAGAIDAQAKTIRYSPPLGYSGTDGFDYAAAGQGVQSAPAHVTLQVQPPASPPPSGGGDGGETGGGGTGTQAGGGAPASHRKAKRMPATPAAAWKVKGAKFSLTKLTIKGLPKGWSVKASCKGKKCPFKSKALKNKHVKKGTLNALKLLGSKHVFRAGQTLELRISAKGYKTKVVRYALKKGRQPKAMTSTS